MGYLSNKFNLKDKTVIITGANGQLGTEFCDEFSAIGSKVICIDKDPVTNRDDDLEYYAVDITQQKEVSDAFETIRSKHNQIDVLINNAGVSVFEPFEERLEASIDYVTDVNLKGTIFCIQSYVKAYDQSKVKTGAIVNIASHFGVVSPDFRNYTDCSRQNSEIYGATKAGIVQMTKYFAVYLSDRNIRVNAVSPGGVYNPDNPQGEDFINNFSFRCPMKRMANANEISGAVTFLASSAASYTNGQNMVVDGGITCW
ncbi:MAG: SDR family oxidoreductase [Bacteroidetes bacterium]|nr:SDR family oxidoreductase [Bacteroidota bacterium]